MISKASSLRVRNERSNLFFVAEIALLSLAMTVEENQEILGG